MCDSPRSRVLSLNVRFYTESSLIRLLSVSAGFSTVSAAAEFLFIIFSSAKSAYIPLRGSRDCANVFAEHKSGVSF